ncbi:hypothetical protein Zmor_009211 [Zophobas morio]|uniref:Uncharacterized protein n=1 Tax=Zophobas morio TaxID=2755281 RepID=A0AA38IQD5_9CUCU|nr:hypothetical protein Zmor_009211 [Zophobas morio]
MRDNFNFSMLPIVQDNMNYIPGVRSLTNLSSNGYYGYQPPLLEKDREEPPAPHACFMEVQFESVAQNNSGSRKRAWDFCNDLRDFKKRRQNEKISANAKKKTDPSEDLFEELLKETHGCTLYHWNSDGL